MNEDVAERPGPLAGVTVIDLSTVLFGPLTSQILADYGANVIKVTRERARRVGACAGIGR